jgi:hypothetical protein
MDMKLGGMPVQPLDTRTERLSMLLWGKSGCGKTVLASTAPGDLLWINFDPDGVASLKRSNSIMAVDMANIGHDKVPSFKSGDTVEAQLRTLLTQHTNLATVVIDSVTSFSQLALTHAILSGKANGGQFKASMETPGKTDKEGKITSITVLLGGSLPEEVPLKISEVWHLLDSDGRRTIGIRPYAQRVPMRTRMFRHEGRVTNFPFHYDQQTGSGDGILTWFTKWQESGFDKIAVPK